MLFLPLVDRTIGPAFALFGTESPFAQGGEFHAGFSREKAAFAHQIWIESQQLATKTEGANRAVIDLKPMEFLSFYVAAGGFLVIVYRVGDHGEREALFAGQFVLGIRSLARENDVVAYPEQAVELVQFLVVVVPHGLVPGAAKIARYLSRNHLQ